MRQLFCKLHFHAWRYSVKGHYNQGIVYPLPFRECSACYAKEICVLENIENSKKPATKVHWVSSP